MGLTLQLRAWLVAMVVISAGGGYAFFFNRSRLTVKWTVLWLLVTTAAYLCGNIWLFTLAVYGICAVAPGRDPGKKLSYYFLLLPAVPAHIMYEIPGLVPGIRYWFALNYPRMLVLFLLIPVLYARLKEGGFKSGRFLESPTDRHVLLYASFLLMLGFRNPSFTEAVRNGCLLVLDLVIPYYAISRGVRSEEDFKSVFSALFFSAILLSFFGLFEELKRWNVHDGLSRFLDIKAYGYFEGRNLYRENILRVKTTLGQAIPFGFFLSLALGAGIYLERVFDKKRLFYALSFGLLLGVFFLTLSRGPWLGFLVFLGTFVLLDPHQTLRRVFGFLLFMLFLFPVVLITPIGQKVVRVLPFTRHAAGTEQSGTLDYRKNLITQSTAIIKKHPWFGSPDSLQTEQMEELKQGREGIIDVVNSYVQIALDSGLVGLALFLWIFAALIVRLFRRIQVKVERPWIDLITLGKVLLALLVSILVIIGTVGSITFIPIYYWGIVALAAGYLSLRENTQNHDCIRTLERTASL